MADVVLSSPIRVTRIFLDCTGAVPCFWRFEFDGTMTLLRVVEGPCLEDTVPGGVGRADPMLPPWLVTFPVSTIALICQDICLLLAVITSRLTISYLTLEAMALNPKGCPSLFNHSLLSTWASISFIRASYSEFSKLLRKTKRSKGLNLYSTQMVNM
jgi:hypothetical protein